MTNWEDALALCPFFHEQNSNARMIKCEGIYPKSTLTLRMRTRDEYDLHFSEFCCKNYKNCELYRAVIAALYADDEND